MKNQHQFYLEKVKKTYKSTKKLLDIIFDTSIQTSDAILLRKMISLKKIEDMQSFVKDLEDHGIHLILDKEVS